VAASETGISIAFGLTTLAIRGLNDLLQQLEPIMAERRPGAVVIGVPLGLEGKPGPVTSDILALARRLEQKGLAVILVDEALSSRKAGEVLRQRGKRSQKEDVDRASAAILLQEYLDGLLPPLTEEDLQKCLT
jgi:putative transcription antitermination factor YqgF